MLTRTRPRLEVKQNEVALLAVLGDGPYWFSALEVLSPPTGTTFYRPFSYREQWSDASLLDMVPPGGRAISMKAVIGLRFKALDESDSDSRFIPLRHATAHFVRDGGLIAHLELRDHIKIDAGTDNFRQLAVPHAQNLKDGKPILARIATDDERSKVREWGTDGRPDSRIWSLLADSDLIPEAVRARFRDRVVIYSTGPTTINGASIDPVGLQASDSGGIRGYKLQVGTTYNFRVWMMRIGGPGQSSFPHAPDFEFRTDPKQVVTSSPVLPFTGNYREISGWVRPLTYQSAPIDLWWHPRDLPPASADDRPISLGLRIPIAVTRRFPWLAAVVALTLVLAGAVLLYLAAIRPEHQKAAISAMIAVGTTFLSASTALTWRALDTWNKQG